MTEIQKLSLAIVAVLAIAAALAVIEHSKDIESLEAEVITLKAELNELKGVVEGFTLARRGQKKIIDSLNRNQDVIFEVLRGVVPRKGEVNENE
jgi:hypothetical protein